MRYIIKATAVKTIAVVDMAHRCQPLRDLNRRSSDNVIIRIQNFTFSLGLLYVSLSLQCWHKQAFGQTGGTDVVSLTVWNSRHVFVLPQSQTYLLIQ